MLCAWRAYSHISQRFRAACNIFLMEAPAELRYAPVFGEKISFSCIKQRCLVGTVHLREAWAYSFIVLFFIFQFVLNNQILKIVLQYIFKLLTLCPCVFHSFPDYSLAWAAALRLSQWLPGAVNVPPADTFLWLAANLLLHRPRKATKPKCKMHRHSGQVLIISFGIKTQIFFF